MSIGNLNNDCVGCLDPVLLDGSQTIFYHPVSETKRHVIHDQCLHEWNCARRRHPYNVPYCPLCERSVTCLRSADVQMIPFPVMSCILR